MRTASTIVAIVLLIGIVIIFVAIGDRNQLVQERLAIANQWRVVDSVLQSRADLAANLVDAGAGRSNANQAILNEIIEARAAVASAQTPQERIQANARLDTAISRFLVAAEGDAQLKSDENFLRLQDDLSNVENRIAVERRKYNEDVQRYNTDIELFPKNIAAAMFGFHRNDAYFKTAPGGAP